MPGQDSSVRELAFTQSKSQHRNPKPPCLHLTLIAHVGHVRFKVHGDLACRRSKSDMEGKQKGDPSRQNVGNPARPSRSKLKLQRRERENVHLHIRPKDDGYSDTRSRWGTVQHSCLPFWLSSNTVILTQGPQFSDIPSLERRRLSGCDLHMSLDSKAPKLHPSHKREGPSQKQIQWNPKPKKPCSAPAGKGEDPKNGGLAQVLAPFWVRWKHKQRRARPRASLPI